VLYERSAFCILAHSACAGAFQENNTGASTAEAAFSRKPSRRPCGPQCVIQDTQQAVCRAIEARNKRRFGETEVCRWRVCLSSQRGEQATAWSRQAAASREATFHPPEGPKKSLPLPMNLLRPSLPRADAVALEAWRAYLLRHARHRIRSREPIMTTNSCWTRISNACSAVRFMSEIQGRGGAWRVC
jgi:hypothetical protein